ncbi:hypothetical protein P152DRAFT_328502 [Eremomyces bilateralis CBS 781.70]|uniref:NADPH oxidase regulator NoxR n=1 Tax=Eremomyces bilateralis CBS 781.70 TaxID=1392243 RepID=A0A6G1G467_9PEZI|nr:uncharacterized protein P152DRAFT_328502 [Eremomyces bilateralis CBS 781.70]KAF1812853.1 hypothetical protein P152DRAFT_328502 [Eremomyces bilateralis CBS 781.70]
MSLKQEIETWVQALGHYDNNEFDDALKGFGNIADTSKILFNMGVIFATLGEHEKAVDSYQRALALDKYLAVAYFQQGVSNFLMGDFEEALANFNDTLLYLRGHNNIDYEQLGLKFKLHSCEALFNRGLCYIYLQQKTAGMQDLAFAAREKTMPDHEVIEDAIREEAEGYTVFSIPVGIIYRPNAAKVKNLKTKDYLGRARLVAASDRNNLYTGFAGAEIKAASATSLPAKDDRPESQLSYAATNLVKPNLISRSNTRLQSEPPINRTVFPPTPPPEVDSRPPPPPDKRRSGPDPLSRAQSVKNGVRPYPRPLDLSVAGFDQPQPTNPAPPPRLGTQRSMSERPRRDHDRYATPSQDRLRGPRRRSFDPLDDDTASTEDVYDLYGGRGARRSQARNPAGAPRAIVGYIEEEDEFGGSESEPDFEMVSRARTNGSGGRRRRASRSRSRGPGAGGRGGEYGYRSSNGNSNSNSNSVTLRKIRVKVHAADTRYVLIGPAVEFADFVDGIRMKFGLRNAFKVMTKEEGGDLITMSDRDDLELAVMESRRVARMEGSEMGKMEVWLGEIG